MMKRALKWIAGAAIILLVVLLLVLNFAGGHVIKIGVEKGGKFALQVPIRLKRAALGLFSGRIELKEFLVENPEGYDTPNAIEVGRIYIYAPFHRFLGSRPRIEEIVVESPVITLEQGLTGSNLYDLMRNTQRLNKKDRKGEAGAPGKKVIIGTLRISDAKVNLSTTLAQGKSIPILLPPLEINELGGEDNQGVTIAQVIAYSLREVVKSTAKNGSGLMPNNLNESLNASVASFDEASKQLAATVGAAGKKTAETLGATKEKTAETLGAAKEKTAETLGETKEKITAGLGDITKGVLGQAPSQQKKGNGLMGSVKGILSRGQEK